MTLKPLESLKGRKEKRESEEERRNKGRTAGWRVSIDKKTLCDISGNQGKSRAGHVLHMRRNPAKSFRQMEARKDGERM